MSSKAKFYQFVIIYESNYLYEVNISEKRAIEHAVKIVNRAEVPEMYFDGRTIYPKRVGQRRIFVTESPCPNDSPWFHKNHPKGYEGNFGGNEVTGEIFSEAEKFVRAPLSVTREGVFFSGQQYDAYRRIRDILKEAEDKIVIIDGYVDENVLDMLADKKPRVKVEILTKQVSGPLRRAAERFNRQHGNLSIRTSDAFHDRFVIIDDDEYYHFGHSLKDLGNKGCMFSRIEEPMMIQALSTEYIQRWQQATQII